MRGCDRVGQADRQIEIDAGPDAVWSVVSDFGGLDSWMPGVDSCTLSDERTRVLSMLGMEVTEALSISDDAARRLTYSIVKAPFAFDQHQATITVTPVSGNRACVTWSVDIRPDELTDMFAGVYGQALDALKVRIDGTTPPA